MVRLSSIIVILATFLPAVLMALSDVVFKVPSLVPLHLTTGSAKAMPLEGQYIVKLKEGEKNGVDTRETHMKWIIDTIAAANNDLIFSKESEESEESEESKGPIVGNALDFTYEHAFNGYAARLSESVLAALRERVDEVEYVAQDEMISIDPIDENIEVPKFVQNETSWALGRISQREKLEGEYYEEKFDYKYYADASGQDTTAYVVDTGIYTSHSDFDSRASWGRTFAPFSSNSDRNGHGTHCAGIIGGKTFGAAKNVKLVAVKVLNDQGQGSISWIIAGIDYVVDMHSKRSFPIFGKIPARRTIMSMSLGGGNSRSLDEAIERAVEKGVVAVVAAGNDAADACGSSPADVQSAVTVGASDFEDGRAFFSNFGKCVDIFAPGHKIISTWMTGPYDFKFLSGTSMATPYVAGVLANIYSGLPADSTVADVRGKLFGNATADVLTDIREGSPNVLLYNPHVEA